MSDIQLDGHEPSDLTSSQIVDTPQETTGTKLVKSVILRRI